MKFKKYEKFGAYHWRQYEKGTKYKKHADFIKEWITEKKILDVGAGDGLITYMLGAVGIDDEPTGVKLAQEKGANVVLGDAYALPFEDGKFEAILMADVLEHFEFPSKALKEARRVLTSSLYITTPPKQPDGKLTDKFHYQEWSPEELKSLIESEGFVLDGDIIVQVEDKTMYAKFRKI